jgi:hypothetical protein
LIAIINPEYTGRFSGRVIGYVCRVSERAHWPEEEQWDGQGAPYAGMIYIKFGVKGEEIMEDRLVNGDDSMYTGHATDSDVGGLIREFVEDYLDRDRRLLSFRQVPGCRIKGQLYYRTSVEADKYRGIPCLMYGR